MKINFKSLAPLFLIIIISSCVVNADLNQLAANAEVNVDLSQDIKFEQFLEEQWNSDLEDRPVFATNIGIKKYNTKISSNSISQFNLDKVKENLKLKKLQSFEINNLNDANKLNYKLAELGILNSIKRMDYPSYYMQLNQRGGVQSYYEIGDRLVFTSKQDYEDWLIRLNEYSSNIDNALVNNKEGLELGYTQPKLVTQGVVSQIKAILDADMSKHPYLKVFINADETILSKTDKDDLLLRATNLVRTKINPSYTKLYSFLNEDYLPNSRDSIGISSVPNGKEWYEVLANYHTTTDLTPDEIHNIGLKEIKRIRSEMESIILDLEWDGDFASFLNYLRTSPRFYYDNPEDLFNAYLIMSKTIDPLLPKIFKVFPRAPYGVKPIPAESAPFTTTAYYNSPSKGKPGYFYANLYKPESRPKYEIPVLTVHEAVPGHHFQISIAQELEGVPTFRKYQSFTAFVEGWGLYSEELGEFIGLYDDPYDKFGQLTYDMWRAIRLVVDTGMHYKGWTRDASINLFLENTAKAPLDIENEVDRYIAWPGQALAYKIGQLKILELRTKAEEVLGDDFDIKDFHHEVLKRGSLPLSMLEDYINQWIEDSLNS
jgi:prolyl oligopeptidase